MKQKVVLVNPWLRKGVFSRQELELSENSVLLIEEREAFPPEFYYIVPPLKRKASVRVIDANALKWDAEKIVREIGKEKADFVAMPTTSYWSALCPTPFYPHITEITKKLKREFPKTKVLLWGSHGTIFPEATLKETKADFLVRGEPELKVAEAILSKRTKKTRGIAFLEKNGVLRDNGISEEADLTKLPTADFSWIDFSHYSNGFSFPVMATRGCPFNCSYCANSFHGKYRERPISAVANEIRELARKGARKISFSDLAFTANKKHAIALCNALAKIRNLPEWHCQTRADCLNKDVVLALKRANCRLLMLGLESASQSVLDNAGKRIDRKLYEQAVMLAHETKLPVHFFVISFLPGETKETLRETIDFLKKSQPVQFSIAVATPLPGSRLWRQMLEKKQLKTGTYLEALRNVGFCGETKFGREFIKEYYKIIPTQIALQMGPRYLFERMKTIIRSPKQALHFTKKILVMAAASAGRKN